MSNSSASSHIRAACGGTTLVIFLLVSTAVLSHDKHAKTVNVQVNSTKTALETMDKGCTGHPRRPDWDEAGCIRVSHDEVGDLQFRLTGDKVCDDAPTPKLNWVLDGLQLANKNQQKPASNAEWDNPTTVLDQEVARDFKVDAWTGWVNLDIPPSGVDLAVTNRNLSEDGYVIWYRLRATCVGSSTVDPIYLDPRIDNEGTD